MPDVPPKRPPTYGDRGEFRRTPPLGQTVPPRQDDLPAVIDEDITGNVDLDEFQLRAARDKRPTHVAIAHHDQRLDDHGRRIRSLEISAKGIEGKVDTTNAVLAAHTAILGSQTKQLDRILDEGSAQRIATHAATTERKTANYRTALTWITPIVTAIVTFLLARGC